MKKNFLPILIITIIIVLTWALLKKGINNSTQVSIVDNTKTENQLTKVYDGEFFSFKYPEGSLIKEDNNGVSVSVATKVDNFPTAFFSMTKYFEENKENLPINEWWIDNGPQNQNKAPYPEDDLSYRFKINNKYDAFYTIYIRERGAFGNEYFAPMSIYVNHNNKIFEVNTQKIVLDEYSKREFDPEEIQNAQDQEKLFWQILDTLEFK